MAEYQIIIKPSAVKEINKLLITVAARIAGKIKVLAVAPRPPDVRKLEGEPVWWRIRARRLARHLCH